jgi:hypothetical protein
MILNFLNPSQGLDQSSIEAPKAAAETGTIERGTLLKLVDGAFAIAGAADKGDATTPGVKLYAALNGDTDADVQFSGVIAAIEVSVNGQTLETSAIDTGETYSLDDYLTIADGGIYVNGVANNDTIYGKLLTAQDQGPDEDEFPRRLVNNRPDHASGLTAQVVKIATMYVPKATVSA